MTPKLRRALFEAIDAVESSGGRYAIVGGLAVGAWAMPRATRDVDLYTDLDRTGRQTLEDELTQFGVFRSRSKDGVFLDISIRWAPSARQS